MTLQKNARSEVTQQDELTQRINAKYRKVEGLARSTVEAAIELGRMLTEKKQSLGHGEWLPWVEENFEGTDRHARRFMKLYRERHQIGHDVSSLREALAAIAEPQELPAASVPDEIMHEYEDPPEALARFQKLSEKEKALDLRECLYGKYMFPENCADRKNCEDFLTYRQMHRPITELMGKGVLTRVGCKKMIEQFFAITEAQLRQQKD